MEAQNLEEEEEEKDLTPTRPRRRVVKAQRKAEIPEQTVIVKNQGTKWSEEEHTRFVEAVRIFGKDWLSISDGVGTRDRRQVTSYGNKLKVKIEKNPDCGYADILPILQARKVNSYKTAPEDSL